MNPYRINVLATWHDARSALQSALDAVWQDPQLAYTLASAAALGAATESDWRTCIAAQALANALEVES